MNGLLLSSIVVFIFGIIIAIVGIIWYWRTGSVWAWYTTLASFLILIVAIALLLGVYGKIPEKENGPPK